MSVRVRFAPSPTGFVHVGGLRTALYNYLFSKAKDGTYLLRIEDTDQERFVEGAVENMLLSLDWAGIHHTEGVMLSEDGHVMEVGDRGPYIQSERLEIYQAHIKPLLASGHAYRCFCSKERLEAVREKERQEKGTPRYDGHCRQIAVKEAEERAAAGEAYVIRLKLPEHTEIRFDDLVRGTVVMSTDDLDDQVLIKSDGYPTYHFAVVVDDHLMEISHVIRGEEWLASTPKHVYLFQIMGWEAPTYVHLPNILNMDRKKLSKRQGDVAAEDFRRKGYLPEALVNFLTLVGWSPEDNQELFTLKELESAFSIERVSKSGGVFDLKKLNWMSAHYMREASLERLTDLAIPYLVDAGFMTWEEAGERRQWVSYLVEVLRENLHYMAELPEKAEVFFADTIEVEPGEAMEWWTSEALATLRPALIDALKSMEILEHQEIKKAFKMIQKETGLKGPAFFKPVRVALTGNVHGPDLMLVMKVLGKEAVLKRLSNGRTSG
ncbi:MAG: glutamate--tRNA ligase [Bacillota bacterium]|nr:glutamate--tRNA ligase [Bacillota bacterium]MDW7677140.1 glutamate--tRNA ligase [Bacillota bacterium]